MFLNFKKLFSVILVGIMLFSTLNLSFADSGVLPNPEDKMVLVENGIPGKITHKELKELFTMDETSESLMFHKNETASRYSPVGDDVVIPYSTTYYKYVESSGRDSIKSSDSKPVTPWINGSQDGGSISYGQSESFTSIFSAGLTSTKINSIVASLGVNYSRTVTSNESFGTTFSVGPNKIARVRFAPTVRDTQGKVQTWRQLEGELNPRLISEESASGSVTKKVGKFADGLYYLEYQ